MVCPLYAGYALSFSRSISNLEPSNSSRERTYLKHVGIYAFKASLIPILVNLEPTTKEKAESLEQLRWIDHGYKIKVVKTKSNSISIDVPADLEKAMHFLDEHPGFL